MTMPPCTKLHKKNNWVSQFDMEELYWPAQSPDVNLTQHLWDELEHRLWARPYHPTSVLDLTYALKSEW